MGSNDNIIMTDERKKDFYRAMSEWKRSCLIKDCFHHDKSQCKGDIKQSHSIQRNGKLSIIEAEVNGNNSVYTFTSIIPNDRTPMADLKPIGKAEASTFFGFCDYHDTVLFSPIENFPFEKDNDKHCFLHSYRSFAHSYHRKHEELKAIEADNLITRTYGKEYLELSKKGIEMAIKDLSTRKKYLDESIEKEVYDNLEYFVYEKEGIYPFAVSSIFSPKVSYYNKPMNNHTNPDEPFSSPTITFLPDKSSTIAIISAFPDDVKAVNLLDELDSLKQTKLEKAITSLIIANCENTFFSPKFWNSLHPNKKKILLDEANINFTTGRYHYTFFNSQFNFFDEKYKITNL